MVVKSATKKKLMDLGISENFAHVLADDRKWDDVKIMTQADIAKICETDSESAGLVHAAILAATQKVETVTVKTRVHQPRSAWSKASAGLVPKTSWTSTPTISTER